MKTAIWPLRFGGSGLATAGFSASLSRVWSFLALAGFAEASVALTVLLSALSTGRAGSDLVSTVFGVSSGFGASSFGVSSVRDGSTLATPGFGSADCRSGCPAHMLWQPNDLQIPDMLQLYSNHYLDKR